MKNTKKTFKNWISVIMRNDLAILGGNPISSTPFEERRLIGEEERDGALRVLDSQMLSGFIGGPGKFFNGGPEIKNLETRWNEEFQSAFAITTNSWTTGIQTMLQALDLDPGDEIIVPPYTMSACPSAIILNGCIPVFADIDPIRLSLDPASIRANITSRTKAIMVVHLLGCPAEMDEICKIASENDLFVIEDGAQSPGAVFKGENVGAIGDIGGFSFNFHKHLHCGEGGLITTNNSKLAKRCRLIRNHGENLADDLEDELLTSAFGSNYRLSELQAAIVSPQIKKIKSIVSLRNSNADFIKKRLVGMPGIEFQSIESDSVHSYYMMPIFFKEAILEVPRNVFLRAVNAELPMPTTWDTNPLAEGYVKPLYINKLYQRKIGRGCDNFPFNLTKREYSEGLCPITENLYQHELLLTPIIHEFTSNASLTAFADAFEKVIENIDSLKNVKADDGLSDPLAFINRNKSIK